MSIRLAGCLVAALLPAIARAAEPVNPAHPVPLDKKQSAEWIASLSARGTPSAWTSWDALEHIGMPVAGIGSGSVLLGGDGRLWCWDIFNQPHEGIVPNPAKVDLWPGRRLSDRDGSNYLNPPKMTSPWNLEQGLSLTIDGKVRKLGKDGFAQLRMTGEYPIGTLELSDPGCPLTAAIDSFSPFIPLAYDDSSLPCAIQEITLRNDSDAPIEAELSAVLENGALKLFKPGAGDKKNPAPVVADALRRRTASAQLAGGALACGGASLPDGSLPADFASRGDAGTLAVAMLGEGARADAVPDAALADKQLMTVRRKITVPAKGEAKASVIFAWHFPGVHPAMRSMANPRRWYAEKFTDAAAVATHVAKELPRLSRETHLFHDTWYGTEAGPDRGTLPHWLLERSLWTVTTLTTNGSYRLTGDRFWGWEGTGSCAGTCTHVWHYGQSAGRLFPQLEIDLRERTDFTPGAMGKNGAIGFRGSFNRSPAIDGQSGILLRCYREHLSDPSGLFLKRNWDKIKLATEFLIQFEGQGKKENDGVPTGRMENTLDAQWAGEVPWLVGIYLAGLTASEEMANQVGDQAFAHKCHSILEKGRIAYAGYFDPKHEYYTARCTPEQMKPIHIGPGCHIDMCLGDAWLAQLNLPPIGKPDQLRASMGSLYRYNFCPDMGAFRDSVKNPQHKGRLYALGGEAGLVMCTWPFEPLPDTSKRGPFLYFQECMSGFEHAAAALMVSLAKDENDPLLTEGLAVSRAVHDRYAADKRNPYNEIECSDHYARAMASYGVFVAACGFHCDAQKGLLRFDPKIRPDDCAMPFVGAGAWGRFAQTRTRDGFKAQLEVRHGQTKVARLEVRAPGAKDRAWTVKVDGRTVPAKAVDAGNGLTAVELAAPVMLAAGQTLTLE